LQVAAAAAATWPRAQHKTQAEDKSICNARRLRTRATSVSQRPAVQKPPTTQEPKESPLRILCLSRRSEF